MRFVPYEWVGFLGLFEWLFYDICLLILFIIINILAVYFKCIAETVYYLITIADLTPFKMKTMRNIYN